MPDELETILRLVADGHLSAEEAEPILDALRDSARGAESAGRQGSQSGLGRPHGFRAQREYGAAAEAARQIRIEVIEAGHQVVNLHVPLGLASLAVERVPGLPGQYRGPILEAIRMGMSGPIVDVGDGDDRVRIILE